MQSEPNKLTTPLNPVLSMDETKILEDVNKGLVTSVVTGNPVDVRSLLGGVTEQDGLIVKAEVGLTFQGRQPGFSCDFRQLLFNGLVE